jgi:hypothetical protein
MVDGQSMAAKRRAIMVGMKILWPKYKATTPPRRKSELNPSRVAAFMFRFTTSVLGF